MSILIFFLIIIQGSRGPGKRPRLEKGQEAMDTDIKKEEDIKTEPKGIKSHLNIAAVLRLHLILEKKCNNYLKFLFRK